jgi:hypothetical protein
MKWKIPTLDIILGCHPKRFGSPLAWKEVLDRNSYAAAVQVQIL